MKKPSVTELIRLLDKPALLSWANKQGLIGVDINKKRKELTSYGTSLHKQISECIRDGTPMIRDYDMHCFSEFIEKRDIIASEIKVENEYFTGVYDITYSKNGKVYLADFKSNAKKIYFEHKLQLVAYSMCVDCDGFAIVSIPDFKEMVFSVSDKTPYIEIIKSLSNIYKQKLIIDENRI